MELMEYTNNNIHCISCLKVSQHSISSLKHKCERHAENSTFWLKATEVKEHACENHWFQTVKVEKRMRWKCPFYISSFQLKPNKLHNISIQVLSPSLALFMPRSIKVLSLAFHSLLSIFLVSCQLTDPALLISLPSFHTKLVRDNYIANSL